MLQDKMLSDSGVIPEFFSTLGAFTFLLLFVHQFDMGFELVLYKELFRTNVTTVFFSCVVTTDVMGS